MHGKSNERRDNSGIAGTKDKVRCITSPYPPAPYIPEEEAVYVVSMKRGWDGKELLYLTQEGDVTENAELRAEFSKYDPAIALAVKHQKKLSAGNLKWKVVRQRRG